MARFAMIPLLAFLITGCITACIPLAVVTGVVGEVRFQKQTDRIEVLEKEKEKKKQAKVLSYEQPTAVKDHTEEWNAFYDDWVKTRLKGPDK